MSTEQFDEYKRLYSKYVDHSVDLHNYHLAFVKNKGYETGNGVRTSLRKMMVLAKQMHKVCLKAYREQLQNYKEDKKREKLEKLAQKKAKGRKKKGNNNDNSGST